jgi:hypothetical protein
MDEQIIASFLDELGKIEKVAFRPLQFLVSGARKWGRGLMSMGKKEVTGAGGRTVAGRPGFLAGIGGAGAQRAGGIIPHMKQIWGAGAQRAAKAGKSEWLGGLGTLARSRYGQMAAVPVAAGGALWAGKKLLGGGSRQPQYQ